MFVEAVIQLHLSFLLIGMLAQMGGSFFCYNETVVIDWLGWLGDNKWLIWLSFSMSVSSATFGLSKFLKIGPVKIVNHDPAIGHNAPFVGFGITMIIIASFMISKAVWVFLNMLKFEGVADGDDTYTLTWISQFLPVGLGHPSTISQVYLFWLLFSMTPQILMVIRSTGLNEKILHFLSFRL